MSGSTDPVSGPVTGDGGLEPSPAERALFGGGIALAQRYAQVLASTGIEHGHLGPREVPRLWSRHLANSAVVTDLVPADALVIDVGSGAGLPGIPMAIRRPDLRFVLVEPMLRRFSFLERTVAELGLGDRVRVLRGRAEDRLVRTELAGSSWVTARAVAPLDRLVAWCVPLLGPGGRLLALKGSSAADEIARFLASAPRDLRSEVADLEVVEVGREYAMDTTHVISATRRAQTQARRGRSQ